MYFGMWGEGSELLVQMGLVEAVESAETADCAERSELADVKMWCPLT